MFRRILAGSLGVVLGLGFAAGASADPNLGTPATRPAAAGLKKVDPKTLEALLKQGRDALAAGEYKAARDAFHDVAVLEPRNPEALHGQGVAYMYLNDFTHAREPMERALTATPSPSRALVLNMAVCQIGLKNPMRAAKIIMDYLTAHPKDLDEPLCNAMGTALTLADDQARKGRMFGDAANFYVAYNTRLEAAKPGLKRWGVQWMKADDVNQKKQAQATAEKSLNQLGRELDTLDANIADSSRELEKQKDLARRGFIEDFQLQQYTAAHVALIESQTSKQKEYDELSATIERPAFPKAMTLVALDDLKPPPVANNVVIVENTPPPAVETIKAPTRTRPAVAVKPKVGTTATPPSTDTKMEEPVISVAAAPKPSQKVRISAYAAAFPITDTLVLTAASTVAGSSEVELQASDGTAVKAELVRADDATGLALVRVTSRKLMPLPLGSAFAGGAVQCAGYPTVNIFNPMSEPITGTAKPPAAADWKVSLSRHPRLGGAPLIVQGKVVGVELATRDIDAGAIPAVTLDQIKKFLGDDLPKSPSAGGPDACSAMLQLTATRETTGT